MNHIAKRKTFGSKVLLSQWLYSLNSPQSLLQVDLQLFLLDFREIEVGQTWTLNFVPVLYKFPFKQNENGVFAGYMGSHYWELTQLQFYCVIRGDDCLSSLPIGWQLRSSQQSQTKGHPDSWYLQIDPNEQCHQKCFLLFGYTTLPV